MVRSDTAGVDPASRPVAGRESALLTPAVLEWVERVAPGARVIGCEVRPLAGGAVARWVEQVTLHLAGERDRLELVRKDAPALEIAGLRAAQAVRPETTARPESTVIPELVAWGTGWLITPLAPGSPLAWGEPVPADVIDALAVLHARYGAGAGLPAAIPRVTPAWWLSLCREWVDPRLREHAARHPAETTTRARALISRAADIPAASTVLARLTPTHVHGDVHPRKILVDGERATLIDWGSCRVGPAALDLANIVTASSADVARYARAWQQHTGRPLPGDVIELGYRWAALQIPVQYLPWMAGHRPTRDVETALDQIEQALGELEA